MQCQHTGSAKTRHAPTFSNLVRPQATNPWQRCVHFLQHRHPARHQTRYAFRHKPRSIPSVGPRIPSTGNAEGPVQSCTQLPHEGSVDRQQCRLRKTDAVLTYQLGSTTSATTREPAQHPKHNPSLNQAKASQILKGCNLTHHAALMPYQVATRQDFDSKHTNQPLQLCVSQPADPLAPIGAVQLSPATGTR